jgi:hypothetical protein
VHQTNGQNGDGFECGDSRINSYHNKEEQSKTNFKANNFKQNCHDGLNRNIDCDKNRNGHHSGHLTSIKKERYRPNNSSSEGYIGTMEGKRSSVNERLLAARQKEGGKNASLASNSMTSQQV